MKDLYVSWADYHDNIESLAVKIYQSNWEFNQIICLAKGGLRIGDILARLYCKPLGILFAASYGGPDNRLRGEIKFSQHLAMLEQKLEKRILLVDDLVDSGISLEKSIDWLYQNSGGQIDEIRTAVIWYKASSVTIPNYYVEYLATNPWVRQPFEKYEQISLTELEKANLKNI